MSDSEHWETPDDPDEATDVFQTAPVRVWGTGWASVLL